MAPPIPPTSTHQTAAPIAPKRRHRSRHAQHQPQLLEEPSSPATLGGVGGPASPPPRTNTTQPLAASSTNPAARGGVFAGGRAIGGTGMQAGLLGSSRLSGQPPLSAADVVSGTSLQLTGSLPSGELSINGRRGSVEGGVGLSGILPGPPSSVAPANGGPPNMAKNLPESAPDMFDIMPVRTSGSFPATGVPTADGEVWERSPETVVVEGSSIRAIFSISTIGSTQIPPSAGLALSSTNAGHTQRPGARVEHREAVDARMEGLGGIGSVPGRSGVVVGPTVANLQSVQAGRTALLGDFPVSTISSSDGLGVSSEAQRLPNTSLYTAGVDGSVGGSRGASSGGANVTKNRASCSMPGPDRLVFESTHDATDVLRTSGQGGMKVGGKRLNRRCGRTQILGGLC